MIHLRGSSTDVVVDESAGVPAIVHWGEPLGDVDLTSLTVALQRPLAHGGLDVIAPASIVPAHGAVGPGSLVAANRQVMQTIQSRARALKATGRSADETATTVQSELVAEHPDWPRANGVAAAARAAWEER